MNPESLDAIAGAIVTVHTARRSLRGIAERFGDDPSCIALIDADGGDDTVHYIVPVASIQFVETEN